MTLFGPFSPPQNQQEQDQNAGNPPLPYTGYGSPQSGQTPSHVPEYQQMMQQQPIQQAQLRRSQPNYIIQPPTRDRKPYRQRRLPPIIASLQLQRIIEHTPAGNDVLRMLIILSSGEQRFICFSLTTPITIKEILEQVHVPLNRNTHIQVSKINANGIDYIVYCRH